MLKSGVSYDVYMKRVWIFDETLSPACFIYYYTLASPAGNSVSSYMCGHFLVSESENFQGCASNVRERPSQQVVQGEKRGRGIFSFPLSPSTRFPSASPYSLYVLVRLAKVLLSFFVLSDLERKNAPHV